MRRKTGKTPTGSGIVDVALKLIKKDPSLSLKDARELAAEKIKESDRISKENASYREKLHYGIGGKVKHKVLTKLFGSTIGGFVSNKIRSASHENSIVSKLLENESNSDSSPKNDMATLVKKSISGDTYKTILKKLSTIESIVREIDSGAKQKLEKSDEPDTKLLEGPSKAEKMPFYETGMSYLQKNYKNKMTKKQMEEAVMSTGGANENEFLFNLVKSGGKGGIGKKAEPLPVAAVPAAVSTQKEALETKQEEEKEKEEKDTSKFRKKIFTYLKDIEDRVSHQKHALLDALLAFLMNKIGLKGIIGFIKNSYKLMKLVFKLVKPIGKLVANIVKMIAKLFSKIPGLAKDAAKFLSKAVDVGSKLVEGGVAEAAVGVGTVATLGYGTYKMASGQVANSLKKDTDSIAKKYGVEIERKNGFATGNYKFNGTLVKGSDLTDKEQTIIDAIQYSQADPYRASLAEAKIAKDPDAYKNLGKTSTDTVSELPALTVAVKRIDAASSEHSSMKKNVSSVPIIHQHISNNNKTVENKKSDESAILISVRNFESSTANYIASIFNHPVVKLPT